MYGVADFSPTLNIGLDFDDTVTASPGEWLSLVRQMKGFGWKVYIVTWRYEHEWPEDFNFIRNDVDGIFCTGRRGKKGFMAKEGIQIDIWIDDNPLALTHTYVNNEYVPDCNELVGCQQ